MALAALKSAVAREADLALSLVSLAGLATVIVAYGFDSSGRAANRQFVPPVAQLTFALMDVRRRSAGTLVWEDVTSGVPLYEEDSVFAAPGASAVVTFNDGARLELDEGTLILLERPQPQAQASSAVLLVKGSVTGTAGERPIEVGSGAGVAHLERTAQAKVSVGSDKRAQVEVFGGSATLRASTGAAATLGAAQSGSLAPDGTIAREPDPAARLDSPARNGRLFFVASPPPVPLKWTRLTQEPLAIQVARDREFAKLALDQPVTGDEQLFTPRAAGIYYWRLVDARRAVRSEVRKLTLVEDLAPSPLAPAPGELVFAPPGTAVPFAWSPVPGVSHYRLEVAASASFSPVALSEDAQAPGLWSRRPLPEGGYFWRVRAVEPERGPSPVSRVASFRLITKPLPQAPELLDSQLEVEHGPRAP